MKAAAPTIPGRLERVLGDARAASRGLRIRQRQSERFTSWLEILGAARDLGSALSTALGAQLEADDGPGDGRPTGSPLAQHRVALVLPTGEQFFHAFFAILWAGAVPVPIYPPPRFGDREEYRQQTRHRLAAVAPTLVWTTGKLRRHRTLMEAVEGLRDARGRSLQLIDAECLQDQIPAAAPESLLAGITGDDLALVQFSSGTTGWAKPVALSHRALLEQTDRLLELWPEDPAGDPANGPAPSGVSWLPLYHDMGLVGCVLPAALRPGDLTLLRSDEFVARPAAWLRAISERRATISPAPDFAYRHCVERVRDEDLEGCDLSSWSAALDGSELVRAETLRRFADRFAPLGFRREALRPVYGMAETALAVTYPDVGSAARVLWVESEALAEDRVAVLHEATLDEAPPSSDRGGRALQIVSVGRPLPDFALEIRSVRDADADGDGSGDVALGEGEVGEIWVQGPSLLDGALHVEPTGEEALGVRAFVRPVLRDGWLATGDRGFLWGGELYVLGRLDDVLNFDGRKLAPERIEDAVGALEGIEDVVAWASGEDAPGDLVLLAECRLGKRPVDELLGMVESTALQAAGRSPSRVHLLRPGQIARTSSGKKRRRETVARLLAGSLQLLQPTADRHEGVQ